MFEKLTPEKQKLEKVNALTLEMLKFCKLVMTVREY